MASLQSIFAPLPVTTRGQSFHLQTDPKYEKLLYCVGPAVIVRDLKNPRECYTYTEHQAPPTAACFAPSGYYICSGDAHGKVRIWDTTQETHIIKFETQVMGGAIKDICWSPDSKRILVGGAGRNKRTHCFMWDSGSSCGSLHPHNKDVNGIAHSPARPFKAVTCSEDFHVVFHAGVPYKNDKTITLHKNFVNCVRYSPSGATFCTVSSDKRALIFDGKTGDHIGELLDGDFAHKGGIMSVSYNSEGSQVITASADKTVKLWDLETSKCVSTIEMGKEVADQQLGCLWAGEFQLSVSFSGSINYLDFNSNSISRVLKGHQKSIETMEVANNKIYTSSFEGRSSIYDAESGDVEYFTGAGHKNKVLDTKISGDKLISVDINNTILRTSLRTCDMGDDTSSVPSKAGALTVHPDTDVEVYTCTNELLMFKNGNQVYSKPLKYDPLACAISPSGTVLAVGDRDAPKLYLYDIDGTDIIQRQEIDLAGSLTELVFSPDGAFLGGSTSGRVPLILDVNNHFNPLTHCWSGTSKSLSCAFSPDSRYFAFAGIDTNILICELANAMDAAVKIIRAHPLGTINRIRFLNNNTIVSTGSDMQVRQFTISA